MEAGSKDDFTPEMEAGSEDDLACGFPAATGLYGGKKNLLKHLGGTKNIAEAPEAIVRVLHCEGECTEWEGRVHVGSTVDG